MLLGGPVVTGFGRGSRQMGVPTANIDPVPLQDVLSGLPLGVYFGCAGLYELRVQELKALQVGRCSAWPTKHGFKKSACRMQMVLSVLQTMRCCQDNRCFHSSRRHNLLGVNFGQSNDAATLTPSQCKQKL